MRRLLFLIISLFYLVNGRAENLAWIYAAESTLFSTYIDTDSIRQIKKGESAVTYKTKTMYNSYDPEKRIYIINEEAFDCGSEYRVTIESTTYSHEGIKIKNVNGATERDEAISIAAHLAAEKRPYKGSSGFPFRETEQRMCIIFAKWLHENERNSDTVAVLDSTNNGTRTAVPLIKSGGVFNVGVTINSQIKLNFIVDSGASDVVLPDYVGKTLIATGSISKNDVIGTQKYQLADGSIVHGMVVNLKSIRIGERTIHNVRASIMKNQNASLLLGQSALQKLGKWKINSKTNQLEIE